MDETTVVVVGGGYAGVMAANRLTQRRDVRVRLVNPRPAFVERIRLHQLVAGSHPAVVDYADVLAAAVELVVGTATRIDAAGRRVELASGDSLAYDHLVYALGSGSADPRVPGAAELVFPVAGLEQAQRLRAALEADPAAAVTVVGAGPTGIEVAAELAGASRAAGSGRTVTLVSGGVLGPYLHPGGRASVARRLAALGVTVLDGPGSTVTGVRDDAVVLADGREVPTGVAVWTAGFGVPDLARRSGLRTDPAGRLLTDETLTSVDDDRVVAAGDAAAPSGRPFRMSCQAAGPLGAQAADTVLHHCAGEVARPVRIGFVGQCVSLGRHDGVVQLSHRDDTARRTHLAGRTGATLKELVCRGTVSQLTWEARWPGTSFVPGFLADPTRRAG
ncbi:MAG: NAD(P)/FAD-dependent oxidoreductase [Janthinobacterium lividum]